MASKSTCVPSVVACGSIVVSSRKRRFPLRLLGLDRAGSPESQPPMMTTAMMMIETVAASTTAAMTTMMMTTMTIAADHAVVAIVPMMMMTTTIAAADARSAGRTLVNASLMCSRTSSTNSGR